MMNIKFLKFNIIFNFIKKKLFINIYNNVNNLQIKLIILKLIDFNYNELIIIKLNLI